MSKDYNILNIFKGITLAVRAKFNMLPPDIKELSEKRMDTCSKCKFIFTDIDIRGANHSRCSLCRCWLPEKTLVKKEECPMDYWDKKEEDAGVSK